MRPAAAETAASSEFRAELLDALQGHFTAGTGAIECLMAVLGAFYTAARSYGQATLDARDRRGIGEMHYAFTVGLPFGNPFWQRASVVLMPLIASAQLHLQYAATYHAAEQAERPESQRATELRRRVAECMSTVHAIAVMALVVDRGLKYAEDNGAELRDELERAMRVR